MKKLLLAVVMALFASVANAQVTITPPATSGVAADSGGWTRTGTNLAPTTATDTVSIGEELTLAKTLRVLGSATLTGVPKFLTVANDSGAASSLLLLHNVEYPTTYGHKLTGMASSDPTKGHIEFWLNDGTESGYNSVLKLWENKRVDVPGVLRLGTFTDTHGAYFYQESLNFDGYTAGSSVGYINYYSVISGITAGTSQFRSLNIGDGKGTTFGVFDGPNHRFVLGDGGTQDRLILTPTVKGAGAYTGTITSLDLTADTVWSLPGTTGTLGLDSYGSFYYDGDGNNDGTVTASEVTVTNADTYYQFTATTAGLASTDITCAAASDDCTVSAAGTYQFNVSISFYPATASKDIIWALFKEGTIVTQCKTSRGTASTAAGSASFSCTVAAVANDSFDVRVMNATDGAEIEVETLQFNMRRVGG